MLLLLLPLISYGPAVAEDGGPSGGSVGGSVGGPAADTPADAAEWVKRLELSYTSTSGNTDTQSLSTRGDLKREGVVRRYYLTVDYLLTDSDGVETANKLDIGVRSEFILSDDYFWFLSAGYLRDRFSGYESRLDGGPGFGRDFIESERVNLKGLISVTYYRDDIIVDELTGEKDTDSYMGGKASLDYEWKVSDNTTFREDLEYSLSFKDADKFFINSVTSLDVRVNSHISLGVGYTINFQNRPPSADVKKVDRKLVTSVIVDF